MLSKHQMMKIAMDECIAMIGKELVEKHKDLCCCACSITENKNLSFCLGMDTEKKPFVMGDETPMEFYAFVIVDPQTGKVTRNYHNSILPE